MARPKAIRAPTTASLSNDLRIPSTTPSLVKSLGKVSRQSLLDLVLQWLDDRNVQSFTPYLEQDGVDNMEGDETSPYPAAQSIDELRDVYYDLQDRKGGKREVIDRILEGDWRHGITLRQLAMVDIRYMDDHPSSLRWTALELSRINKDNKSTAQSAQDFASCIPRLHASTFLTNLQHQVSPLVKAHYHLARSTSLPLTFLRIFVTNSPYQNPRQLSETLTDSSRVIYVAFPDSCPFIYTSISAAPSKPSTLTTTGLATDSRSLQRLVREAIPKALSRQQERYTLQPTSLTAKSLRALLALRGPGRSNAANGAFSIFADAVVDGSPLDPRPANTVSPEEHMGKRPRPPTGDSEKENENENRGTEPLSPASKKRKLAVHSRFGTSASLSSAPLDRLDVKVLDKVDRDDDNDGDDNTTTAQSTISLTFAGSDVFAGIRKLADLGVVDPERMPSWMTGEEAVSVAVVQRQRRVTRDTE